MRHRRSGGSRVVGGHRRPVLGDAGGAGTLGDRWRQDRAVAILVWLRAAVFVLKVLDVDLHGVPVIGRVTTPN